MKKRGFLPIVTNFLQVAFFFTPIMWSPELLQDRGWIADFNPLYHLIEIVRAPVLGTPIQLQSWVWSIGFLIVGFAAAQYLMMRARHRLTYWL